MENKENCDCQDLDLAAIKTELADYKSKVDAVTRERDELRAKLEAAEKAGKDAVAMLDEYRAAEKKALVESIMKHSEFKADELNEKSVEELRLIHTAIDRVKPQGTVKNVRGTDGETRIGNVPISADGRIDNTKSPVGYPKRGTDGRILRDGVGSVIWEVR